MHGRALNFDPSKYGVTLEQWEKLSRVQRKGLWSKFSGYEKQKRDKRQASGYEQKRYARDLERRRATARLSYWRHHEKQLARSRARWAKQASLNNVKADPDKVYWLANKAVPAGLPRHVRDDVLGSILLAVMEGRLLVKDMAKRAVEYVRAHNREFDHFKTVSLDAPLAGTDGMTRMDTLDSNYMTDRL